MGLDHSFVTRMWALIWMFVSEKGRVSVKWQDNKKLRNMIYESKKLERKDCGKCHVVDRVGIANMEEHGR